MADQMIEIMQLLREDYREIQVSTTLAQAESVALRQRVHEIRWQIRRLGLQIGLLTRSRKATEAKLATCRKARGVLVQETSP